MRIPAVLLCLLTLSACSSGEIIAENPASSSAMSWSKATSSSRPPDIIEAYPSTLSVEHFSQMTLSGTDLTLTRVLERAPTYVRHHITYRSNGVLVSGILNIPTGEGPHKLLMLNHGFIDPAVYTNGRGLRREQDYLARQGFAVLHSDYRGHAESDDWDRRNYRVYDNTLAYAMDVANAILAVRNSNLTNIDADSVGMLGHSMGGGVAQMIAVGKADLVDAVVLYAPIHGEAWKNFMRWRNDGPEGAPTLAAHGTFDAASDFWNGLSQKQYYDRITAPVLLFQGTKDDSVPKEWADEMHVQMTEAGVDATYVIYEGEGHEFGPKWSDFMQKSAAFFEEHL